MQVQQIARSTGTPVHVDGARIFNASVKLGVPITELTRTCDTLTVCLSKGLGCPIGTLLAGPADFIERAKVNRKLVGGAMRQTGIVTSAGIYALGHNVARLADDHRRAFQLASGEYQISLRL